MKKLLLLCTIVCCLLGFNAKAATVSGTISSGSSTSVSGLTVYLVDSTLSGLIFRDTTTTSSSGAYSFTVASSISTAKFQIITAACGTWWWSSFSTYSGSNLTINQTVCTPITVTGSVYYSSVSAPGMKVYLMDSSSLGITYKDSTIASASGAYSFSVPNTVSSYRVYANACGARWSSAIYSWTWGNQTINISLGCPSTVIIDTVRNSTTLAPVFGQKVYLLDSSATTYRLDSAVTNRQGVVYFFLPPTITSGNLQVYTNACGRQSQNFTFAGSNMTAPTLHICLGNAVISGTMTNTTTSLPVPGQYVAIIDSSSTGILFYDSVMTNASGFYSSVIPVGITSGTMIAAAQACGSRHANRSTFSGSSMTLNLSVCATSTATVSGVVTSSGSTTPLVGQKVYLIDSAMGATSARLDSTVTNASGAYSFTIPPTTVSSFITVRTPTCGGMLSHYHWYSGYSLVSNFAVNPTTAKTISGTIYNKNGTTAAGVTVMIQGSGSGTITGTTNSSGAYSLTIPCSWSNPGYIDLGTNAVGSCGVVWRVRNAPNYTGSNIVWDDTLCYSYNYYVKGTVMKSGTGVAANAKVYLILRKTDTSVTPAIDSLRAVDSTVTNSSGQYYFGMNNVPYWPGSNYNYMLVKAALQPGDPAYSSFMPCYHDSALLWSSAATAWPGLSSYGGPHIKDIWLKAGTNPGGPGFIGGSVLMGANKSAGVGDPLESRPLLLTNAAGQPVAHTRSDATGQFSFKNLAHGTYKVFGDAWGKANPELVVTIGPGSDSVDNIVFEENSTSFTGYLNTTGVGNAAMKSVRVFPNPASDYVNVDGLSIINGTKTIVVRNVTGAIVATMEVSAGNRAMVQTGNLPAGIYSLQVQSEAGTANFRFMKQ